MQIYDDIIKEKGCYLCKVKEERASLWTIDNNPVCDSCFNKPTNEKIEKIKELAGTNEVKEILSLYNHDYMISGRFGGEVGTKELSYILFNMDDLTINIIDRWELVNPQGEYKCDILGWRWSITKEKVISFGVCNCPHSLVVIKNNDIDPLPTIQFSLCLCEWTSIEAE